MSVPRLVAVCVILAMASAAWVVLGGSVDLRTNDADAQLRGEVGGLWGRPQVQAAPAFALRGGEGGALRPAGSDVVAAFDLDQRRKGLLWYATYVVDMDATYRLLNPHPAAPAEVRMRFPFPDPEGVYDGFGVTVDGEAVPVEYADGEARTSFVLPAGSKPAEVRVGYRTNGLDEWTYEPTDGIGVVEDFSLSMLTDFDGIDFPEGAVSPTEKRRAGEGWDLTWDYARLVSGRPIALTMPKPLNPGPVASRISYFAPVGLLFYFAALLLLTVTSGLRVHPMNYAFLAGGFFAFHLLFAYLADQVPAWVAFAVASAVSLLLCVGYLRAVVGGGRALVEMAVGQTVFLVLFSFSFFFDGFTGLAVTIGSVLTLAFFMMKTAHVDWTSVFGRGRETAPHERGRVSADPVMPTPPV